MIRVFVVDDHAVLREGLRLLLATAPDLLIVGEANNGQELLAQLPTTPADAVLLDVHMPVLDGLATVQQLHAHYPQVRILMLSMLEEPRNVGEALAAGAHGYVLKNANKYEVIRGIRTIMSGNRFLCSEIGLSLLDAVLTKHTAATVPAARSEVSFLSRREHEVLQLVANGLTTQQIAEQLFTSRRTIETHRQNILIKTGCKNTAALISWASAHQLL